jgi:hypothetical protein
VAAVLHRVDPAQASRRASANRIAVTGNRAIGRHDPLAMASGSRIRVMANLLANANRIRVMENLLMASVSRGPGTQSPATDPRDPHVMASESRIRVMASLLENASPGLETANQPTVNASHGLETANQPTVNASRGPGMRSLATDPRDPHVMVNVSRGPVTASPELTAVAAIVHAETLKRIR